MKAALAVLGICLSSGVFAAPDEEILGKSQGYPVCPLFSGLPTQSCFVGQWSHFDQIAPARKVARGASVRPLKRADKAPELGVDQFLERARNTGLLVLHGDTVLAERYQYDRKPEHRFYSASMSKTVVAMLVGIALDERALKSIDDKAAQYVPELRGHPYGDTSLRHLLTMSSGVRYVEAYDGKPGDHSIFRRLMFSPESPGGAATVMPFKDRDRAAGEKFSYAGPDTQVLTLVLRAAVGRPLADYLSEKIWQPMGAEADATWLIDKAGYENGAGGLNATLRDWGRFGLLLANDGVLDGRQIIPAHWVRSATTAQAAHLQVGVATRHNGYGYQTWLIHPTRRHFALLGIRGQGVFVDPYTKLVVVHTAVHALEADLPARGEQFRFFYSTLKTVNQT